MIDKVSTHEINKPLVWVTGARGFIGSATVRYLLKNDYRVGTLGHGSYTLGEAQQLGLQGWIDGGVELSNLDQLAAQTGLADFVVHLAGGASVGKSILQPWEDFQRTVTSTQHLLEWIRSRHAPTKLVYISSAAVYGNGFSRPIRETDQVRPSSPYGSHKLMAEELIRSYCLNFGVSSVILRPFSVYGPNLRKQLIYDLCERLSRGVSSLELSGTGDEIRDWLHIEDLVRQMTQIAPFAGPDCEIFNAGTGEQVTVREIAQRVAVSWGFDTTIRFNGKARSGDPEYLVSDTQKVDALGGRITWPIETGLDSVVQWYREHLHF